MQIHRNNCSENRRATILALHGSASNGKQWRALSEAVAGSATMIAPDLPGYGWIKDDPSDRFIAVCSAMSDITGPVHLVAHSFGGAIALRLAETQPEKVASLTLYDPLVIKDGLLPKELRKVWQQFGAAAPSSLLRGFLDFWSGCGSWDALSDQQSDRLLTHVPTLRRDFHEIESGCWDAKTNIYTGPISVLWGGDSPEPTLDMACSLNDLYPHSEHFFLPGHGHLSPLSHPHRVARFFQRCVQRNAGLYAESTCWAA